METIKSILMRRDGMSAEAADDLIRQAAEDLNDRLDGNGYDPFDICPDWFGIEADWNIQIAEIASKL